MFYLEDDSEDEEKVHEDSLRKTEDIYYGKAPTSILVSYIHLCPGHFACSVWIMLQEGRTHIKTMSNALSLENVVS